MLFKPQPLALAAVLLLPAAVSAATFTVNSTGDDPLSVSVPCNGGITACTLRAAIEAANSNPASSDTINFNFSGGSVTIEPQSPLPAIAGVTIIDGYASGAGTPNSLPLGHNASISIRIDGANAGVGTHGLQFVPGATGSVLRGVAITRFSGAGVAVDGQAVEGGLVNVRVTGNFIGTDGTGAGDDAGGLLANGIGVFLHTRALQATVGGPTPGERNVIVASDIGIDIRNAPENRVLGNYIGTNLAGDSRRATATGIRIWGSRDSVVTGNVIGAADIGVLIGWDSTNSLLQGNLVGLGTSGGAITAPGSTHGIHIVSFVQGSPQETTIGGSAAGQRNTVAFWGGNGIRVELNSAQAPTMRRHTWRGNSIHGNGALGIELIDTVNGVGGDPMGAPPPFVNLGPRSPNILSATGNGAATLVSYEFAGVANAAFRMEVFANTACDPTGFGEGQTYLGAMNIATDSNGFYAGTASLPVVPSGALVTMTATPEQDLSGLGSSEFSRCIAAAGPGGPGPAGNATAIPTVGHAGLALLSAAVAGMGVLRRRRVSRQ